MDNDAEVDADDSGYFSDGELSTTDLEEVDDDEFFRELESNDGIAKILKRYEIPVKAAAEQHVDNIDLGPTNSEEKDANIV